MGDLILLAGMIVSMITGIGALAAAVWHLLSLHWLWMLGDIGGVFISAALVVTFSRVQRNRD